MIVVFRVSKQRKHRTYTSRPERARAFANVNERNNTRPRRVRGELVNRLGALGRARVTVLNSGCDRKKSSLRCVNALVNNALESLRVRFNAKAHAVEVKMVL